MALGISALEVLGYFQSRMHLYDEQMQLLRKRVTERTTLVEDTRPVECAIEEMLLMISEDNIYTTAVRLEKIGYDSIIGKISAFREFIDQQRFIFKILFDYYNKSY